jgi:hypothetical protein
VNDWVKAGLNLSASMTKSNSSGYTGSAYANVWYSAQFMAPIYPVWLKDETGKNLLDELGNKQLDYGVTRPNLHDFSSVGTLYDDKFINTGDNVSARTFLAIGSDQDKAGWLKGLKLTANLGLTTLAPTTRHSTTCIMVTLQAPTDVSPRATAAP